MFTHLDGRGDRRLQVAHVVHRIKDAKYVDAVESRALYKFVHDVVGIVPVTENILTAKQHLLGRIGHCGFEFAYALPGVLA